MRLKRAQRLVSRKVKGGLNRRKARGILGKRHLKISRQRKRLGRLDLWVGCGNALHLSPIAELRISVALVLRVSILFSL